MSRYKKAYKEELGNEPHKQRDEEGRKHIMLTPGALELESLLVVSMSHSYALASVLAEFMKFIALFSQYTIKLERL